MRVVITAGGTSEMIDSVRSITNKSSGKLGSLIAENFYNFDNNIEVVYDCGRLLVYVNGNLVAENYDSNDVSVKIDL